MWPCGNTSFWARHWARPCASASAWRRLRPAQSSEEHQDMTACIVGWAHTPFGKHEGADVESLMVKVIDAALSDAGVEARDIDRIFVGHFNAGFSKQDFPSSLALQASAGLRFKPATRVENACATGSAAVHAGLTSLAARQARLVLVVGVEKMTDTPGAEVGANLLKASYLKE